MESKIYGYLGCMLGGVLLRVENGLRLHHGVAHMDDAVEAGLHARRVDAIGPRHLAPGHQPEKCIKRT